jgi:sugar lactone lactonase YvrE
MVTYETAFAVPVGPDGLAYSPGGPDRPATGPNAFHIAPDGTCWISDNESSRVRRFAIDGKALETVELGGEVTGISTGRQ